MLTALDSDVIKTYVEMGMGVGIIAQMAYDPARDTRVREARCGASVRAVDHADRASPRRRSCAATSTISSPAVRAGPRSRGGRRRARRLATAVNDARDRAAAVASALAATRNEPRRTWSFAALLASLSMLAPFAIDSYLPAFPAIGQEFGVPPIAVQQTLSAYLISYAFMMLWHGALSDALGRRPIVLAGLVVYAFATLGCAIAGNIESLWLFRILQGLSAGSGLVVGRAIVRDSFHGPEAQRLMAQMTLVFGIAPRSRPSSAARMLNFFGWRAIFWMLLMFVVGVFVWAAKSLPETLPRRGAANVAPARAVAQLSRRPAASRICVAGVDSCAQLRRLLHLHCGRARRFSSICSACRRGDLRGCSCR